MVRYSLIAAAFVLATACGGQEQAGRGAAANMPDGSAPASAAAPVGPAAAASRFAIEEDRDGLAFSYSWPAEAEAIPPLRARLRAEMEAHRREASGYLRDERQRSAADGRTPMEHLYSRSWTTAGDTPRLLSLSASEETFTGGAHGNQRYFALIWDRQTDAPVAAAALLGPALAGFGPRFCAALNAERAERRGEPVPPPGDSDDSFNACPSLAELVVVPADDDGSRRFERLAVLIPPYVAGPYAEGGYVVDLPFAAADIARVPENWRGLLEPGRPLPEREE